MTTLIFDGYIVKEKTDRGRMFLYSDIPDFDGADFSCKKEEDVCFDFDAPIREFINVDIPTKCKITIELE